jgi:hypothetical protein
MHHNGIAGFLILFVVVIIILSVVNSGRDL